MNFFDSLNPKEIVKNIKEIIHCPFCGFDYQEKNIKILAKFEGNYVIHLKCNSCSNSILASFSYRYDKIKTLPKEQKEKDLDVKFSEMIRFVEKGKISDDDVMDFYKNIKDFDGDFKKIFSKRERK